MGTKSCIYFFIQNKNIYARLNYIKITTPKLYIHAITSPTQEFAQGATFVTATVTFETCGTLNPATPSVECPTGLARSNASKKSPALIGLPFISVIKLDLLSRNRTRFGAPLFRYSQMEYLNRETVL